MSGHKCSQHPEELAWLQAFVRTHGLRSWLEIGAREGDTLHAVGWVMPPGSRLAVVDLPEHRWGRKGSAPKLQAVAEALRTSHGHHVTLVQGDSQQAETRDQLPGTRYDAVFIDADHTLAGVFRDWTLYGPLARRFVVFHDIAGLGQVTKREGLRVEVPYLWRWLATAHRTEECVAPGSRMGLGVLHVPEGGLVQADLEAAVPPELGEAW